MKYVLDSIGISKLLAIVKIPLQRKVVVKLFWENALHILLCFTDSSGITIWRAVMHSIEITRLNVIRTQIGCVEALWMHRWFRGRSTCILLCAIHCGIWCNQLKTIAIICVRTQYKRWNSKTTNTNAYIFINRKLLGQSLHWSIKLNGNNAALMHVNGQRKNYFYRQSKWIPMALLNSFLLIFFFILERFSVSLWID